MVELAEIQAAYYMVADAELLVAAVFYVVNLRETSNHLTTFYESRITYP